MNPIQTDPNPKNDSITEPPEMTPVTRFSHSSQEKKRSDNRRKAARYMQDLHRRNTVGDMLYMVGFWVEYVFVCVGRRVGAVVRGIGDTVLNLLLIVLRPILIGIITLIEDLTSPFVRMASGIRHIRDIPDTLVESEDGDVRRAKKKYLASGIRKYSIVVWNAITYILPAVAAAGLVVLVRSGLGLRFVLNVQVNGENVGYVESEQVFENAREDVQSRINTAKRMLQASGSAVEDTSWDVYPTYSLSIGNQTMTESEIANASCARPVMRSSTARLSTSMISYSTSPPRATTCAAIWKNIRHRLKMRWTAASTRRCPQTSVSWTVFICRSLSAPTRTSSTP